MSNLQEHTIRLRHDVSVTDAPDLVDWYLAGNVRRGPGYFQTRGVPVAAEDRVEFGDLAWAVLLEGRPSSAAAQSILKFSQSDAAELESISTAPLHTLDNVDPIVDKIVELVRLPGVRASVATKTLHPKRRASVPVIDNQAILGTLANPTWTLGDPVRAFSGTRRSHIENGLAAIRWSVSDSSTEPGWRQLEAMYAPLTRIEVFDMCWWAILRRER